MRIFEKYTAHLPGGDRVIEVATETAGFAVRTPVVAAEVADGVTGGKTKGKSGGGADGAAAEATASEESLLTWEEIEGGRVLLRVDGRTVECRLTRLPDGTYRIEWRGRQVLARVADDLAERARLAHAAHTGPLPLRSPMPGTVVKVLVTEGDEVSLEQPLLVVEAMKMQNEIAAPIAGTVINLTVKPGQAVEGDQVLLEIRA